MRRPVLAPRGKPIRRDAFWGCRRGGVLVLLLTHGTRSCSMLARHLIVRRPVTAAQAGGDRPSGNQKMLG
jgi:hypothetical protein